MLPVDENNTRHHLELARAQLIKESDDFDQKYGSFSVAFLTSVECFGLLVYLLIACICIKYRKPRTRTHWMVAIWAITNFLYLLEKTSRNFTEKSGDYQEIATLPVLGEFAGAISRSYGTFLYIVWFFTRYHDAFKPKYDFLLHFLTVLPLMVCLSFVGYFFFIDEFIYEVYTPGSDIVNIFTYFTVTVMFIFCQVSRDNRFSHSHYAFLVSIVNLVTNFPICLASTYLRFVLDISWRYRFHIYLVDLFLDILACSNSFIVLFITILCNKEAKKKILGDNENPLLEKM